MQYKVKGTNKKLSSKGQGSNLWQTSQQKTCADNFNAATDLDHKFNLLS